MNRQQRRAAERAAATVADSSDGLETLIKTCAPNKVLEALAAADILEQLAETHGVVAVKSVLDLVIMLDTGDDVGLAANLTEVTKQQGFAITSRARDLALSLARVVRQLGGDAVKSALKELIEFDLREQRKAH